MGPMGKGLVWNRILESFQPDFKGRQFPWEAGLKERVLMHVCAYM